MLFIVLPSATSNALFQALQKCPLGTLTPVPPIKTSGGYRFVWADCSACGKRRRLYIDNVLAGKTTNCRCQRNVKYHDPRAAVLGARYDAMVQRCCHSWSEPYPQWGGRGIELRFASREEFVRWMLANLPHPTYKGVQIDRIDNDGHYEPGNLRLATFKMQLRNKQTSRKIEYAGQQVNAVDLWHLLKTDHPDFSLGPDRVAKLVGLGYTASAILAKKGYSISLVPDPAVVSLYRAG